MRPLQLSFLHACYSLLALSLSLLVTSQPEYTSRLNRSMDSECNATTTLIPPIDEKRRSILRDDYGIVLEPIEPLGARVTGLDVKKSKIPDELVLDYLEREMAERGFLVFDHQGVLTPDEQCGASRWFGGRELHSTHGVHPATPNNHRHIFRLSNDPNEGIVGVGPQWHNDGSFTVNTFSHVGYHIVRVPERGGGTYFAHQGAAFDRLTPFEQEQWPRMASVNSNSGVIHPLVHKHPISKRKSVWLHLGMTGAILERLVDVEEERALAQGKPPFRLLNSNEMKVLFHRYNDLLNEGMVEGYAMNYQYQPGDFIVIDNLAIAHKASPEAHKRVEEQGLRILHRTTVRAIHPFKPGLELEPVADIHGPKPIDDDDPEEEGGGGVWIGGGIGLRWDDSIHMQN